MISVYLVCPIGARPIRGQGAKRLKTIVAGKEECIRRAAGELLELVKAKSDAALVSSAERDELWVLEAFVQAENFRRL